MTKWTLYQIQDEQISQENSILSTSKCNFLCDHDRDKNDLQCIVKPCGCYSGLHSIYLVYRIFSNALCDQSTLASKWKNFILLFDFTSMFYMFGVCNRTIPNWSILLEKKKILVFLVEWCLKKLFSCDAWPQCVESDLVHSMKFSREFLYFRILPPFERHNSFKYPQSWWNWHFIFLQKNCFWGMYCRRVLCTVCNNEGSRSPIIFVIEY